MKINISHLIWIIVILTATTHSVSYAQRDTKTLHNKQAEPVKLDFKNLFEKEWNESVFYEGRYNPILIKAKNYTSKVIQGTVVLEAERYSHATERFEIPLDLQPEATQTAQVNLYIPSGTHFIHPTYVSKNVHSKSQLHTTVSYKQNYFIPILSPQNSFFRSLKGQLLTGLDSKLETVDIEFDPLTGDPILPQTAAGWSSVELLISTIPLFERADSQEKKALYNWVKAGGRILFLPKNEDELRLQWVQNILGSLEWIHNTKVTIQSEKCRPYHEEICSTRYGLGRFFVYAQTNYSPIEELSHSENSDKPIKMEKHPLTQLIQEPLAPVLPFGIESLTKSSQGYQRVQLHQLRRFLDPNVTYTPSIPAVAIIILIYVFLIGPVNYFYMIQKFKKPTLVLLSIPALAILALTALGITGISTKGLDLTQRSVEIFQTYEGQSFGSTKRYTGLYHGRPTTYELTWPLPGMAHIIRTRGGEIVSSIDYRSGTPTYKGVKGSFWGTLFVEEENIHPIEGTIDFDYEGEKVTALFNKTHERIKDGIVFIYDGISTKIYSIGTINPKERVPLPSTFDSVHSQIAKWNSTTYPLPNRSMSEIKQKAREFFFNILRSRFEDSSKKSDDIVPAFLGWVSNPKNSHSLEQFKKKLDLKVVWVLGEKRRASQKKQAPIPEDVQ